MNKYVAYVSTYTMNDHHGIRIYDVDMERGRFTERGAVEITNASYISASHDGKHLYAITDFGVEAYDILPDGNLEKLNRAPINGMRGCYLSSDFKKEFLFVAGYHDGKITVLRLRPDGSVGEITDEVYLKGLGSVAERNFRPHVNCVKMSRDNKYMLAADIGMDQVNVYRLNHTTGKIRLVDVIHGEIESAPRHLLFSESGRYLYVVHEIKNYINVYCYTEDANGDPEFEKIQTISTLNEGDADVSAASALNFSEDMQYVISSNAGDDSVVVYKRDRESGLLKMVFCLPISGDYPKDATLFPDNRHLVSLNHESDTMTFFNVDLEKGVIAMNGKEMKVHKPNRVLFHRISEE